MIFINCRLKIRWVCKYCQHVINLLLRGDKGGAKTDTAMHIGPSVIQVQIEHASIGRVVPVAASDRT